MQSVQIQGRKKELFAKVPSDFLLKYITILSKLNFHKQFDILIPPT